MHFTYQDPDSDLQQGDVLKITDALREVLGKFHPYYASHRDYRYLMVLTQSCDLARHGRERCKASYITLSAVRPLATALNRELMKHQFSSIEREGGVCSVERQHWVRDFLVRLLNNNNPEYFYLAEDAECALDEAHVAFLKLAVPIKAQEHYDECIGARVVQLKEVFQAKLGWLVGNMYSRVGTPDWVPGTVTDQEFSELVEYILSNMCLWIEQPVLRRLRRELKNRRQAEGGDYSMPEDEVRQLVTQYAQEEETQTERNIGMIIDEIEKAVPSLQSDQLDALGKQLKFNEEIRRFLR